MKFDKPIEEMVNDGLEKMGMCDKSGYDSIQDLVRDSLRRASLYGARNGIIFSFGVIREQLLRTGTIREEDLDRLLGYCLNFANDFTNKEI